MPLLSNIRGSQPTPPISARYVDDTRPWRELLGLAEHPMGIPTDTSAWYDAVNALCHFPLQDMGSVSLVRRKA